MTPDQQAFIRAAIESGWIECQEDAIRETLALWEAHPRKRAALLATLADASASLDRGEGIPITQESTRKLAGEVKRRGVVRLTAECRKRQLALFYQIDPAYASGVRSALEEKKPLAASTH